MVLAGAEGDDDNGSTSGSAYVFRFDSQSSAWVQEAKLLSSDVAGPALFGKQVAISGDAVLLGARDANGFGAAYVFRFDGAGWTEEQKLVAGDPAPVDRFGFSVGISGDSVVVGAALDDDPFNGDNTGAAYVLPLQRRDLDAGAEDQGVEHLRQRPCSASRPRSRAAR